MDKITAREKDVFDTICKYGITDNKDIAKHLEISENTVKTLLKNIYEKTGKHNKADLIYAYWIKNSSIMKEIIRKGILNGTIGN